MVTEKKKMNLMGSTYHSLNNSMVQETHGNHGD